jgi:hypothetical protein
MELYDADVRSMAGINEVIALRSKIADMQKSKLPKDATDALSAFSDKLGTISRSNGRRGGFGFGFGGDSSNPTFDAIQGQTITYLAKMEFGDIGPSRPVQDAVKGIVKDFDRVEKAWSDLQGQDLKALNALLAKDGLATLVAGQG